MNWKKNKKYTIKLHSWNNVKQASDIDLESLIYQGFQAYPIDEDLCYEDF
jgi:hypothetical protein